MPRPEVEVLSEFGWKYGNTQFLRGVTDVGNLRIAAPFDATEEAENERMTRIVYAELFSALQDPIKLASRVSVPVPILLSVMENVAQRKAEPVFRDRDGAKVGRVPTMFFQDLQKAVSNKEIKARERLMTAVCVSVSTNRIDWLEENPEVPDYAKTIVQKALAIARTSRHDKGTLTFAAKRIADLVPSEDELDEIENTKQENYVSEAEQELADAKKELEEAKREEAEGKIDTEDTKAIEKRVAEAKKEKSLDPMNHWYKMEVVKPPLETTKKMKNMEKKNSFLRDSGRKIVRISRALTDGRCFRASKKKKMAGTILIDNSGSMGLSPSMVEDIIMNSPGTTVAIYSGNGQGTLTVVASRGKVASAKMFTSRGGNDIDGPALEWLGRQEEPRVWVSDGQVFGRADEATCHKDVAKIRARSRIKWLDTKQFGRSSAIIDDTIKALVKGNFKDGGDTYKSNYKGY